MALAIARADTQHLQLAREICRRFDYRFGNVFPEPKPRLSATPRIVGLDGKHKMSKSRGNTIDVEDPPKIKPQPYVLVAGGEKAGAVAQKTMNEVHRAMGMTTASQGSRS